MYVRPLPQDLGLRDFCGSPFPETALMTSWLITPPSTADTGENSARLTRARCRIASADKKSAGSPLRANSSLAS